MQPAFLHAATHMLRALNCHAPLTSRCGLQLPIGQSHASRQHSIRHEHDHNACATANQETKHDQAALESDTMHLKDSNSMLVSPSALLTYMYM